MTSLTPPAAANDVQQAWLDSIQATLAVVPQAYHQWNGSNNNKDNNNNNNNNTTSEAEWEQSLEDLNHLEIALLQQHNHPQDLVHDSHHEPQPPFYEEKRGDHEALFPVVIWNDAPTDYPPRIHSFVPPNESNKNPRTELRGFYQHHQHATTNNDSKNNNQDDKDDEAGDEIFLLEAPKPKLKPKNRSSIQEYSMHRLLLRIYTGQAELLVGFGRFQEQMQYQEKQHNKKHAHRNYSSNKIYVWSQMANLATRAFERGQQALIMADTAVSAWYHQQQQQQMTYGIQASTSTSVSALKHDAEIVAAAVQNLGNQQERLVVKIRKERHRLEHVLLPQWERREAAKKRVGDDKWYNNPKPKNEFRDQRRQQEEDLAAVEAILHQVQVLQCHDLVQLVQRLQDKLNDAGRSSSLSSSVLFASSANHDVSFTERYNGRRPERLSGRVSWKEYPDPEIDFDWTFTGSTETSCVEYFEKEVWGPQGTQRFLLAFYYTTAVVKLYQDFPNHGNNRVFQSPVSPAHYTQILSDPSKTAKGS